MPYSIFKVNIGFERIPGFLIQGRRINKARIQLKMEATYSSQTSVDFQLTTPRYIPEYRTFLAVMLCSQDMMYPPRRFRKNVASLPDTNSLYSRRSLVPLNIRV
jgi:hypothetical protein